MNACKQLSATRRLWVSLMLPLVCGISSEPVQAADKPNIVLIFIDDMGYADIGPFGSKVNQTPNLDRMAREGILYYETDGIRSGRQRRKTASLRVWRCVVRRSDIQSGPGRSSGSCRLATQQATRLSPEATNRRIAIDGNDQLQIDSLVVNELKSAWPEPRSSSAEVIKEPRAETQRRRGEEK